jgi:hypothetical protein
VKSCKAEADLNLCNNRKSWPPQPKICAAIGCEIGPCKAELFKACYDSSKSSGRWSASGPAFGCKVKGPGGTEWDGKTPPIWKSDKRDSYGY